MLDVQGQVIRTFTTDTTVEGGRLGLSTEPGHHRVTWDMRYQGPRDFEGLIMWAANTQGPLALATRMAF